MSSKPVLDIDPILAPVPGDSEAGEPLDPSVVYDLDELRKEVDPNDYPDDYANKPAAQKADWPKVLKTCEKVLKGTSKDLRLPLRMLEALTRQHGFTGLRDGLTLVRRFVDECWDRMMPPIEEPDDVETRASWVGGYDVPDRGVGFPTTVRSVPIVGGYNFLDWQGTLAAGGRITAEDFEKAVVPAKPEYVKRLVDDLEESYTELGTLVEVLERRMGDSAPRMIKLREAIDDNRGLVGEIWKRKAPVEESAGEGGGEGDGTGGGGGPLGSRDAIYRRLQEAADQLERLE